MDLENKTAFPGCLVKDLFFNRSLFSFLKGKWPSAQVPVELGPWCLLSKPLLRKDKVRERNNSILEAAPFSIVLVVF